MDLVRDSLVFPAGHGYPQTDPTGQLVWGDNLGVMAALMGTYENQINLIYVDPPFFTNRHYSARVGRAEDSRRPQDWLLAEGYADSWPDLEAYLDMLYTRLALMYRLLAPDGTLYLHLDWHANAYARVLLDEIFGSDRLLNEIIWVYHGPSPIRSAFNRKHDTLLVYTKSAEYTFNVDDVRMPYDPNTVKTFASSPRAGFGKQPDLERGKVPEDWWYFPVVARLHSERTGYPTQKPEALLERIILASSNPGDIVADLFCGSGTTPVIAHRLGRRFLAVDAAWRAIQTTRIRLAAESGSPVEILRPDSSRAPTNPDLKGIKAIYNPVGDKVEIELRLPEGLELAYWEVDPDWDGVVFRSAFQAIRPLRRGEIPLHIEMGVVDTPRPAAIRCTDPQGFQIQLILNKPSR